MLLLVLVSSVTVARAIEALRAAASCVCPFAKFLGMYGDEWLDCGLAR